MATIFFSMSGDGRGHATRIRTVVEILREDHDIHILAPGDAYDFLAPIFENSDVVVEEIPGLRSDFSRRGKLDYAETARAAVAYLQRLRGLVRALVGRLRESRANLVITDFEPALPRAARRCGIPFISFDHQHCLVVCDLRTLPRKLQRHAWFMGMIVRAYCSGQSLTIVSSFYSPPLKPEYGDVLQVGVILRAPILLAEKRRDGHYVAYVRHFAPDTALRALQAIPAPVYIYGLGECASRGNLLFKPISEEAFISDLSACEALITTAGNQLVGEALYLGKPVLALPEPGNYEQHINGAFLEQMNTGISIRLDKFSPESAQSFIAMLPDLRRNIVPEAYNGNPSAIRALQSFINRI